jgi:hypothetical protein
MKRSVVGAIQVFVTLAFACIASSAHASSAQQVQIIGIDSPNQFGHVYVTISAPSNCPSNPQPYFIIRGWGDQTEPGLTNRKAMLQLAMLAFSLGKKVTVNGGECYLDKYLFADQVIILE